MVVAVKQDGTKIVKRLKGYTLHSAHVECCNSAAFTWNRRENSYYGRAY